MTKRQPYEGFIEVGEGPQGKQGFWIEPSLIRTKNNRVGINIGTSSAVYVDDNGVNIRVGDGLEVTAHSPVAVRAVADKTSNEIAAVRVQIASTRAAMAGKASQADLESLASEVSAKASQDPATLESIGLVKVATDPNDVDVGTPLTLADAIAAILALQAKNNELMQNMRDAGTLGK